MNFSFFKFYILTALLLTFSSTSQASLVSIGDIVNAGPSGFSIPGTGITATGSSFVTGGASVNGGHGIGSPNTGGTFNGALFNSTLASIAPNVANITRLSADRRSLGTAANAVTSSIQTYGNSAGIHIQFDSPARLYDFYAVDLDGVGASQEWFGSYALNGSSFVNPTYGLNSTTDLQLVTSPTPASHQIAVNSLGLPGTPTLDPFLSTVQRNTTNAPGDTDPDDPRTQAWVDYNGALATDLFLSWGVFGAPDQNNITINSGVSGLSVLAVDTAAVPEPSSVALVGIGLLLGLSRRRKSC